MFYKHLIKNAHNLAEGTYLRCQIAHDNFIIVKKNGNLLAYKNICPHQNRPLDDNSGRILDEGNDYLRCQHHGALFTLDTGQCIAGPCQGQNLKQVTLITEEENVYLITINHH